MDASYYVAAAVLAAALLVVEMKVSEARKIDSYRFKDTINNLSNFLGELVLTAILYLNVFAGYHWLEQRVAVFRLPESSPLVWVLALLGLDLVYYCGHRLCHRVGALWALHAVHHQSGEYNLGVGLRGPWLSAIQIAPFMVPIAMVGVPSSMLFPLYAVHTVWKLLVHTRLVGKLGALEWVLATPSQHRVHHGANERFIDRNFGGLFSVWDRIFGTFQVEDEVVRFAPGPGAESLNPVMNNVAPWRELFAKGRRAPGRMGWLRALVMPPSWEPSQGAGNGARTAVAARGEEELSRGRRVYLSVQLVIAGTVTLALLSWSGRLPAAWAWGAGAWSIATIICLGGLMQGRSWAARAEAARLGVGAAAVIAVAVMGKGVI